MTAACIVIPQMLAKQKPSGPSPQDLAKVPSNHDCSVAFPFFNGHKRVVHACCLVSIVSAQLAELTAQLKAEQTAVLALTEVK